MQLRGVSQACWKRGWGPFPAMQAWLSHLFTFFSPPLRDHRTYRHDRRTSAALAAAPPLRRARSSRAILFRRQCRARWALLFRRRCRGHRPLLFSHCPCAILLLWRQAPAAAASQVLFQVPVQVGGASSRSGSGARRPAGTTQKSARDSGGFAWARLDLLFRQRSPPSAREDEADPRVRRLRWGSARWRVRVAEGRRSRRRKGGGLGRRGKKREWERQWVVTSPIEETWVILSHYAAYQTRA
jgi:hypothetical protein